MQKNHAVDWGKVKRLRAQAFAGMRLTKADFAVLQAALNADRARYTAIGAQVRSEYRRAFRLPSWM